MSLLDTELVTFPMWLLGAPNMLSESDREAVAWVGRLRGASSQSDAMGAGAQVVHWCTHAGRLRPIAAPAVYQLLAGLRDEGVGEWSEILDCIGRLRWEFRTPEVEHFVRVAIVLRAHDLMGIDPAALDHAGAIRWLDLLLEVARGARLLRESTIALAQRLAAHESEGVRKYVSVFEKRIDETTSYIELDLD